MIACLLSSILASRLLGFDAKPPTDQIAQGRAVYHSGAGIDRTLMDDRIVLGTWFDGRVRRAVDTVTWVSPELTARWLGYLAERDAISDEVLATRWQAVKTQLGDNLTFIVRLAAFPRLDPFELGIGAPPQSETLRGVKFRLSFETTLMHATPGYVWSNGRLAANCQPASPFELEKENPADVTSRPFYSFTKYAPLFTGAGEVDKPDDGIPLGDYYGAVYVIQFPSSLAMR